jgi:tetratricopeptide (TPR) repeat protein
MKSWTLLVALAASVSAVAADKDKNKDKDKKKEAAAAPQAPAAGTPDALVREAEAKVAAGDAKGAVDVLRRAAALPGAGGEVSLRLGRLLDEQLELDSAIDAYTAAAAKLTGPSRAEALGRMAVDQELRAMPQSSATAAEAVAADATSAWANVALARARAREGKGDEALALAQKAEAAGAGAAAVAAMGAAQEAQGDLAAAEASYRRAQADGSQRVAAGLGLVRVLRKTARAAEAEPLVKAILEQAPGVVEAYKESARVKIALGRASEATGDVATAAALSENDPDARHLSLEVSVGRAVELIALNRPDEALAELKKVTEGDPAFAEAHFRTGWIYHVRKRDAAAALPHLEKAVAAAPASAEYRTQLGAALIDLKQFDRAAGELAQATTGAGEKRAEGWIYLGAAKLGGKKYKEAVAALDKATALSADNAMVEAYLAWSYFGLKDSKAFVAHASRAKALGHKEPTLLDYLGRVEKGEPIK